MRTGIVEAGGVRARAVAGTHAVLFAFDVADAALRSKILGFAIQRGGPGLQPKWLKGLKVFKSVVPSPPTNQRFSTLEHPVQSLIWGDYGAEAGTRYRYVVRPVLGVPGALKYGPDIVLDVETEPQDDGAEGIWFNRGAIASQYFAEKFKNKPPQDPANPDDPTTEWLSRGLLEACLAFIGGAQAGETLLVAAYEFVYAPVLQALADAHARKVIVRVVFDASSEKDTQSGKYYYTDAAQKNLEAVELLKLAKKNLIPRLNSGDIPHNKFIVKLDAARQPVSVWTGSSNFTPSGFLGQSNVGHLVHDAQVASSYQAYWKLLARDLPLEEMRVQVEKLGAFEDTDAGTFNPGAIPPGTSVLFSPRSRSSMLKWYAQRVEEARQGVMWTGAFSVDKNLAAAFEGRHAHPRFLLLEKPPSRKTRDLLAGSRNLLPVYGNVLGQKYVQDSKGELTRRVVDPDYALEDWFRKEEHYRRVGHVFFVHCKFMLVDPLGEDPLVFTGSANFSSNSLLSNDENMLLIRGSRRVADIYLTEFDRLIRHFFFRNVAAENHDDPERGKFLYEKPVDWIEPNYKGFKDSRRRMFFPD